MKTTLFCSNAAIGDTPDVLSEIHQQHKNIAIFERDIFELREVIESISNKELDFRHTGSILEIQEALKKYLQDIPVDVQPLIIDITQALVLFQSISKSQSFRILLATIHTNMCKRFHADFNDLRLLCTYSGQGTMWLPEEILDRRALDGCKDNDVIVKDKSKVQQVSAGDLVILKGATYPKDGTKAIVHRSPSIEEFNERRLLLRIDTNDFLIFS